MSNRDSLFSLDQTGVRELESKNSGRGSVERFPEFLEPLVAASGRNERREGAALNVQGLLTRRESKSVELMAARLGGDMQLGQKF